MTAKFIPYIIQGNQAKQCIAFGNLNSSVTFKLKEVINIVVNAIL